MEHPLSFVAVASTVLGFIQCLDPFVPVWHTGRKPLRSRLLPATPVGMTVHADEAVLRMDDCAGFCFVGRYGKC